VQQHQRGHLTTGVPTNAAAPIQHNQTVPDGISYGTRGILEAMQDFNIQLLPLGTAPALEDLGPELAPRDTETDAEESTSRISSPRPRRILSPLRLSSVFHFQPTAVNPRPRPHQPAPRNYELPPRSPVFTRPPPPPAQPEAGPSRLPAQAGPSRRAPAYPQQPEEDSSNPFFIRPSLPQRPRAPSPGALSEASPLPMNAPGLSILRRPEMPQIPVPQSQPVAGPSRPRVDPRDIRFKLPGTPEHLR